MWNIGISEELQPFGCGAGLHHLREPFVDEIVVPGSRADAVEAWIAIGLLGEADQSKERVPLFVRIDQCADIAVAGLVGATVARQQSRIAGRTDRRLEAAARHVIAEYELRHG